MIQIFQMMFDRYATSYQYSKLSNQKSFIDGVTQHNRYQQLFWTWAIHNDQLFGSVLYQSCFEFIRVMNLEIGQQCILNDFTVTLQNHCTVYIYNLMTLHRFCKPGQYSIKFSDNAIMGRRHIFDADIQSKEILFDNWIYYCDKQEMELFYHCIASVILNITKNDQNYLRLIDDAIFIEIAKQTTLTHKMSNFLNALSHLHFEYS